MNYICRTGDGGRIIHQGTDPRILVLHSMEPIDERITAARLMVLRAEANAPEAISALLGVPGMPPNLAALAEREIAEFVQSGDATVAAQLIHAAEVRRSRQEA